MNRAAWTRASVIVMLLLLLALPASAGGHAATLPAGKGLSNLLATFWQGLTGFLFAAGETRGGLDPFGQTGPAPETESGTQQETGGDGDQGPGMDPMG